MKSVRYFKNITTIYVIVRKLAQIDYQSALSSFSSYEEGLKRNATSDYKAGYTTFGVLKTIIYF